MRIPREFLRRGYALARAPLNPAFVKFTAEEAPRLLRATEQRFGFGYIPSPVPPERHVPGLLLAASPTDPAYDMRDPNNDGDQGDSLLTAVRNQASCGSCWTFATYGAFESHLKRSLTHGLPVALDTVVDLQEGE